MDIQKYDWACSTLLNDEVASDAEMRAYFIEGGMSPAEADHYIAQRAACLKDWQTTIEPYEGV
jgi:hypothetical protein